MKPSRAGQGATAAALSALTAICVRAETVTWDADAGTAGAQDGSGSWSASDTTWWNGAETRAWTDGQEAVLGSGAGAVRSEERRVGKEC